MLFKEKISDEARRLSSLYIGEVNKIPLLDAKSQYELARSFLEHGNIDARDQLIKANLRLVIERALAKQSSSFPLIELIAVGNEGLLHAMNNFNLEKKTKFSSYAYFWIDARIKRYIKEYSETIHMPHNKIDLNNSQILINDFLFKTTGVDMHNYDSNFVRIEDDIEDEDNVIGDYDIEKLMLLVNSLPDIEKFLIIKTFGLNIKLPRVDIKNIPILEQKIKITETLKLLKEKLT